MQVHDIILVNEQDQEIGTMEKMEAHEKGLLHRAFSIFIFNSFGGMLLQQRALDKYHSSGLWTNACCSHPKPGEKIESAAHRRLKEELGFDVTITKAFTFTYQAHFDNGLTENEYDHVFIGIYDGKVKYNKAEVNKVRHIAIDKLQKEVDRTPELFTEWFKIALPHLREWLTKSPFTHDTAL
jgi:isopentenyl-diphosphate Delta-isomerase